ncbi:colicin immunity domain-containing protein [Streptomyces sp. M-16]
MGDLSRGSISPPEFAKVWLVCRRRALNEGDRVVEALSRRLDQVFYALDDYPIDPAFREAGDVTDAELLSVVVNALDQIRQDEEPRTDGT